MTPDDARPRPLTHWLDKAYAPPVAWTPLDRLPVLEALEALVDEGLVARGPRNALGESTFLAIPAGFAALRSKLSQYDE